MDVGVFAEMTRAVIQSISKVNVTHYPRESFREGLWNHRRTFVCLFVCLLPR